ncbi:MAG: tetratricopeptide repeat protein [Crocinitomicaceae bacterium]|nr:tetratricopeptide repeat protein [Crocinitomicaceae bacterium]
MLKTLFFWIFSSLTGALFCQTNAYLDQLDQRVDENPDSVQTIVLQNLEETSDIRKKIPLYHLLGQCFLIQNLPDSALYYLHIEDSLLDNYAYYPAAAKNKALIADVYYDSGKLTIAEKFYTEALSYAEHTKDYALICGALLDCGWIAREQGRHAQALDYYFRSIQLAQMNKDEILLANAYGKIAIVYNVAGDLVQARSYYYQSMNIYYKHRMMANVGTLYNNIGLMHEYAADYDSAIWFFEKAKHISDSLHDERGVAIANENIGLMYYQKKQNLNEALVMLNNSLTTWRNEQDIFGQCQTLIYMIYIYRLQGLHQTALDSSFRSLEMAKRAGARDVELQALEQIYLTFNDLKHYDKALEYYLLFDNLSDSLSAMNANSEIDRLALQHEFESKQLQDSLALALEHEQKQAAILLDVETGKFWNKLMLIILLALALVSVLIFYLARQQRKNARIVSDTNLLLQAKNKEIIDSITYAKRIQNAILPSSSLIQKVFSNSFVLYKPKDIVAGDFYWYAETAQGEDKTVFFAVADCTGHGVPGAMVSVVCNNALNRVVKEFGITNPAEILNKVREIVISEFEKSDEEVKDGMDISLISIPNYSHFKNQLHAGHRAEFYWAGANNPLWIFRNHARLIEEIKPDKQPIGKYTNLLPFSSHRLLVSSHDRLYLFTDGFADQFGGEKNKKMKYSAFKNLILSSHNLTASDQREALKKFFITWRGAFEQVDDVCVAGIFFS